MPDWRMHLNAAKRLSKKFAGIQNINDFYMGSVIPDTPWLEYSMYNQTDTLKYKLHHYIPRVRNNAIIPNYYDFLKRENAFIRGSDVGKGMLFHMILDAIVNTNFNKRIVEFENSAFGITCYNDGVIYVYSVEDKTDMCYDDLHAYEDILEHIEIDACKLTSDTLSYIRPLGYIGNIVDIIDIVHNKTSKVYDTSNIIFTRDQYDRMIDDAISIFVCIMYT